MHDFEIIANDNNLCGEGPVWDAENARLYWTDILGLKFYRYEWKSGRHTLMKDGFEISGFTLDESGGFVVANSSGVWRWDGAGDPQLILDRIDDEACTLNDCIADPQGD
jgi:sugar lactone lactonase YvrE